MIDPEIGWFEIVQYSGKQADTIENLVEQTWLCRYTRPRIIKYDCRNEFLGQVFKIDQVENECGIKSKCGTTEIHKQIRY